MSDLWTSEEIATAVRGRASGSFAVNGVAFDSREVVQDDLFIALKGEATDGHNFLEKAFAQRASGAITSQVIPQNHVLVDDCAVALNDLGSAARNRMAGKVIGVTGSVGKTGTKEALFHALDRCNPGRVHRSVKSYNNHVGVPLSLARMPRDTSFGIFEMGMNHAGELSALTQLVRPDVAIVTTIAPAHIEFFGTEAKIAEAKAEIFEGLRPGGTAIIPYDSPHISLLYGMAERFADNILTFGMGDGADIQAKEAVASPDGGTLVTAKFPSAELCFTVGPAGEHWVSNALAVLAAVYALNGDLAAAGLALAEMPGLPGRGERLSIKVGEAHALLIDESYNANPISMAATLKQLGREPAERRVAILGGMRELGSQSAARHVGLLDSLTAAKVDYVILVGEEMRPLDEALDGILSHDHVPDAVAATVLLQNEIRDGDVILVKGSNGIGLSRLVAALRKSEN